MPELPEVETICRELSQTNILHQKILSAAFLWEKTLEMPLVSLFCQKIQGQEIEKVERRGKFIVLTLTKDYLLIHLRMTGKLWIKKQNEPTLTHERARLNFAHGYSLIYEDSRKFGRWYLIDNPSIILGKIGVEPLSEEFTLEFLRELISCSKRGLKALLLDQHLLAGLGNIYVDEALWLAGIHPSRKSNTLTKKELELLYEAIPTVLKKGIESQGTTLGNSRANYYSVSGRRGNNQVFIFRKEGEACPRCGKTIEKEVIAGRGTHFCPACQKRDV